MKMTVPSVLVILGLLILCACGGRRESDYDVNESPSTATSTEVVTANASVLTLFTEGLTVEKPSADYANTYKLEGADLVPTVEYTVWGRIKNGSDKPLQVAGLIWEFLDVSGNVIAMDNTLIAGEHAALSSACSNGMPPGGDSVFLISLQDAPEGIVDYHIQVVGKNPDYGLAPAGLKASGVSFHGYSFERDPQGRAYISARVTNNTETLYLVSLCCLTTGGVGIPSHEKTARRVPPGLWNEPRCDLDVGSSLSEPHGAGADKIWLVAEPQAAE